MSPLEVIMLALFGISWPISIAKAIRTKQVRGKSPLFMVLISLGYLCGIVHKIHYSFDWVSGLYALNMVLILVDLGLYYRYLPRQNGIGLPPATTMRQDDSVR